MICCTATVNVKMEDLLFCLLSSDSSDDENDELEIVISLSIKKNKEERAPRVQLYVENVVHLYNATEFKSEMCV